MTTLLPNIFDGLLGDKGAVRQAVISGEWNTAIKVKTSLQIAAMHDLVVDSHRPIPGSGRRWDAGADAVHLFRRALPRPGAIGIFVDTGFVRDF